MAAPPDSRTARASIVIAASPEKVYDLVVDVARMGQWSPEATGTVGGVPGPVGVGDHFWGSNRRGIAVWVTRCTVLEADRGRRFAFNVDFGPTHISRWAYDFAEVEGGGCLVTETWHDRRGGLIGLPVKLAGQLLIPGPRAPHNQRNIEISLQRLKVEAER